LRHFHFSWLTDPRSHTTREDFTMSIQEATSTAPEIVWGAVKIAPHIGRSVKGAFGALERGQIPGAKKIAGRWALNLRV
jgi:hypothetical protein